MACGLGGVDLDYCSCCAWCLSENSESEQQSHQTYQGASPKSHRTPRVDRTTAESIHGERICGSLLYSAESKLSDSNGLRKGSRTRSAAAGFYFGMAGIVRYHTNSCTAPS